MSKNTNIAWSQNTWNPVTGCTKLTSGCANCYAERLAHRLKSMGQSNYKNGFKLTIHEQMLNKPREWSKPSIIFVNSMSDLFHEDVPLEFIQKVVTVISETPHHNYQILTKRSARLLKLSKHISWPSNVLLGVTIESSKYKDRIKDLNQISCRSRFVSFEPLLDDIGPVNLINIDWIIVGGETGHQKRLMKKEWVDSIFNKARAQNIPFFFKQWSSHKTGDNLYNGKLYQEMPAYLSEKCQVSSK
jgi:protein gp37